MPGRRMRYTDRIMGKEKRICGTGGEGFSRASAAGIARDRFARTMVACEVYEDLPAGYAVYWRRKAPKNCWYAVCGLKEVGATGGSRTLICVSKRSGRVLLVTELRGE